MINRDSRAARCGFPGEKLTLPERSPMKPCASQPIGGCPGHRPRPWSRREWLAASANGFGLLALAALIAEDAPAADLPALPRPHYRPRARNVIFLFMDGGVSHVDSFDPKPELDRRDGQTYQGNRKWLKSPWKFGRHGRCGMAVSELFPHVASCADDIAVIRSMKADLPLHSTGVLLLHTGLNNA